VTIGQALGKSVGFLILGVISYVAVLAVMRASAGENIFQPQSDYGILLGAAIVAVIVIARNLRDYNGNQDQ
jgi:uncharacterized membrane protein YhhN